ncbi:App1 family protein [Aureimonas sp. AU12]|uniref:App1 family protein n=1 Tax=Aureimonas sp. AU12 TaxID=1638161 RepID=UPI0007860CC5|nr:phosphatase domain-containing protein [Aureimonas sp. AU12]
MSRDRLPLHVVGTLVQHWGTLRTRAKIALGLTSAPILLPYRGLATDDLVRFSGRVIEDEKVVHARPTRSPWRNLWRSFRRYETDEIRKAAVSWRGFGLSGRTLTTREGFFSVEIPRGDIPAAHAPGDAPWAEIALRLEGAPGYRFAPIDGHALVRCVSPKAGIAVISDIDDTIVETSAQHFFRHLRTVALNSAEGRVAFPGIATFYRALAAGRVGGETNPVFYVSSSPWNLHELFTEFLDRQGIPAGPMMLKDFGITPTQWLTGGHRGHKLGAIEALLAAYPRLGFVLIGDTGQSDAEIYAETVRRHPGRIVSVHLRDVSPKGLKSAVASALDAIRGAGVTVTTSPTLEGAAEACERLGLVAPGTHRAMLAEIEAGVSAATASRESVSGSH